MVSCYTKITFLTLQVNTDASRAFQELKVMAFIQKTLARSKCCGLLQGGTLNSGHPWFQLDSPLV